MPLPKRRLLTILLMKATKVFATATCYLPDGNMAKTGDTIYEVCNATAADSGEGSACCAVNSSVCLTSGYCFGSDSYVYRGGCTDQSWRSLNCPSQCLDGKQHPALFIPSSKQHLTTYYPFFIIAQPERYANIYACGADDEVGTYSQTFCCGGLRGDYNKPSCCSKNFTIFNMGIPYVTPWAPVVLGAGDKIATSFLRQ